MVIYISEDTRKTIRKNYNKIINHKELAIIDINDISKKLGFSDDDFDIYSSFLLYEEISKNIKNYYQSKRFKQILYIINKITIDFLDELKSFLRENNIYFTEFVLIDYSGKVNPVIYKNFDNVI